MLRSIFIVVLSQLVLANSSSDPELNLRISELLKRVEKGHWGIIDIRDPTESVKGPPPMPDGTFQFIQLKLSWMRKPLLDHAVVTPRVGSKEKNLEIYVNTSIGLSSKGHLKWNKTLDGDYDVTGQYKVFKLYVATAITCEGEKSRVTLVAREMLSPPKVELKSTSNRSDAEVKFVQEHLNESLLTSSPLNYLILSPLLASIQDVLSTFTNWTDVIKVICKE